MQLLKDVREAPDGGAIHVFRDIQRGLDVIGRHLSGVIGPGGEARILIPLGVKQRIGSCLLPYDRAVADEDVIRDVRGLRLVRHHGTETIQEGPIREFLQRTCHALQKPAVALFSAGKPLHEFIPILIRIPLVLYSAQRIARVLVGRDEIERDVLLLAEIPEGLYPLAA